MNRLSPFLVFVPHLMHEFHTYAVFQAKTLPIILSNSINFPSLPQKTLYLTHSSLTFTFPSSIQGATHHHPISTSMLQDIPIYSWASSSYYNFLLLIPKLMNSMLPTKVFTLLHVL